MVINKIKNNKIYPVILLIFLSLIWGSSFILIKKGLLAYTPLQVGSLRIVFAFVVLLPIALKNYKSVLKSKWKQLFVLGIIANLAPAILFAIAETNMNSSIAGMLNSLTPMFTIIIAVLFYNIKTNIKLVFGLIIALFGSIVLSLVGSQGEIGEFNEYALLVIAATILYGIAGNMIKSYVGKIKPVVLVALSLFTVGPLSLILLLSTDFVQRTVTQPDALFSIISIFILGAAGTAFALSIFNKIAKMTSAVFASTSTYLIPIVAILWGILDNETLFPLHIAGSGIIILGTLIINKYK